MQHALRIERTTAVDRARPFRVGLAEVQALLVALGERRGEGPALVVAVVDVDGVRLRVLSSTGPTVVSVGRHPACDLPVLQADASMRHAVVVGDDDGVRILDLSSSFGLGGRGAADVGRWALARAGDSVIFAAALAADDAAGDVDELRRLCAGLDGRLRLDQHVGPPSWTALRPRLPLQVPVLLSAPARRRHRPVVEAGGSVSLARVGRAPVLLGRDERCDVRVVDDGVSRVHAALVPVRVDGARRVMVVDVGSTNGTTVLHIRDGAIHEVALGPAGRGQLVRAGDMVELAGERVRLVGAVDDGEGGVG